VENSGIQRHPGAKIKEILGSSTVEGVLLDNGERIEATGVFIELGAKGALELAAKLGVSLDPDSMKYVEATRKQETNVAGVFAAGDICGPPWQMAKAVGEGCVAGMEAANYAKKERAKQAG
jgi:thioredoxin reductase (NADPH)